MQNVTTIEKLLKDELSATEAYQKALEELNFPGGQFTSNSLKPMFGDHQAAVSMLQEQIVKRWAGSRIKAQVLGVRGRK